MAAIGATTGAVAAFSAPSDHDAYHHHTDLALSQRTCRTSAPWTRGDECV